MPKPPNKQQRTLTHIAMPTLHHNKLKEIAAHNGSNITDTVNMLVENYLIENNMIQKVVDKSIIVDV